MPELAAHLERAKELLDKLGLVVDGLPCYGEDLQAVAAALAACAREATNPLCDALREINSLQHQMAIELDPIPQQPRIEYWTRKIEDVAVRALERAVEEKA